jgi:Spy/CpxP family protein refolding chaperone
MMTFRNHAARFGAVAICTAALCAAPMVAQRGMMTPEQRQAQFDSMSTALSLTDDQKTKIKAIQDESMKKMADLRASGGDPADMRPKMMEINTDQTTKIKAVLTDEQKPKYDAWVAANRPQGGRGGGMGGPPPQM